MLSFPITHYAPQNGEVMVTTWNTENLGGTGSATKTIVLPFSSGNAVDWGDGTVNNLNTHVYASGGVKTIKVWGRNQMKFDGGGDCLKLTDVSDVGGFIPIVSSFDGCSNLTWSATNSPLEVPTMNKVFRGCTNFNGDISNWDVSKVASFGNCFTDCTSFNQDISGWDVSSVTNFVSIFKDATAFNQDISGWDVSSATTLSNAFNGATAFNQDLSSWNVSNVTTFNSAFRGLTTYNPNIGGWDVSSGLTFNSMVRDTAFNRDISGWDISGATDMTNMMNGSSFSTANYDLLLPAWEAQAVQNNVVAHFGSATYGAGSPATARAALIADHSWTITDGGPT